MRIAGRPITSTSGTSVPATAWTDPFRAAFEHAPVGMAVIALDGRFLQVNSAFCRLLGATESELLTLTLNDFSVPDARPVDVDDLEPTRLERQVRRSDGGVIWVSVNTSLVRDAEKRALYFVVLMEDINDRKRAERELRLRAEQDALTGLLNRRGFLEALRRELLRMRRKSDRAALLLLDLDHFKLVNDTFGHAEGDRLLHLTANALRQRLRAGDIVGRLGGDEFAALLLGVDDDEAAALAAGLGELVHCHIDAGDGLVLDVRASVGYVLVDRNVSGSEEELLAQADQAMYAAKLRHRLG